MSDYVLAKIDQARRLLAEAKTVQEAKHIADVAEAARVYAKRVEASIITVNHAAEIKICAERLLGEMLSQTPKNAGARGIGKSGIPLRNPTLATAGVSLKQSARSQKLASIPGPQFEHVIQELKEAGKEITTAAVLRARPTARQVAAAVTNIVAPRHQGDSEEMFWSRGLLARAEMAQGGALFEDWSHFQVEKKHVVATRRAAKAWRKLADYIEELYETKKANPRAA